MLNQLEKVKGRWGGKSSTIDNWLQERQDLLIQFCQLAGLGSQASNALPDAGTIDEFCSLLMDYLSAGHFEVYEILVSNDEEGERLKKSVYPLLANTTDKALAFNDKYAEANSAEQASSFDKDLAALGETLEERFELEDELINHMYHSQQETSSPVISVD
ncbi:sigma D regulator [Alteromonas aestuariivivens]|uniref:Sigma D regulator n=1 Tax=Alteromonas aestuariivivens TaxID=1938339 RepID=A0A3D8M7I3_9ALTE|nr:sigma D regulator [Alteromonas aestuariivivens]RDV25688.1 sigma D regulator [Alteromonas aestuariivivens]